VNRPRHLGSGMAAGAGFGAAIGIAPVTERGRGNPETRPHDDKRFRLCATVCRVDAIFVASGCSGRNTSLWIGLATQASLSSSDRQKAMTSKVC